MIFNHHVMSHNILPQAKKYTEIDVGLYLSGLYLPFNILKTKPNISLNILNFNIT